MTKTIAQLWNGNLSPVRYSGNNNSELQELAVLLQRHIDNAEKNLQSEDLMLFKKFNSCIEEYMTVLCEQAFCDGYSLGTKITAEALVGDICHD